MFDPNLQTQYFYIILEKITKESSAILTGVLGNVHFPQENLEIQLPPQPYTICF